ISAWHATLLRSGGKGGAPLSPRTVGHAHRLLHRALELALKHELIARNVAHPIRPPKVEDPEIAALKAAQVSIGLAALEGHPLQPIVVLALSTGARRAEMLALPWGNVDLVGATMRIERSLEQTRAGVKFKAPKTKNGRRTVALPAIAVEALQ